MKQIKLTIEGVNNQQTAEFIEDLKSIEGIEDVKNILELSQIEFKEVCVPIVIYAKDVLVSAVGGLITAKILKFFGKEKSRDTEPIKIVGNHNKNTIIQGDSEQKIVNNVNIIFNLNMGDTNQNAPKEVNDDKTT